MFLLSTYVSSRQSYSNTCFGFKGFTSLPPRSYAPWIKGNRTWAKLQQGDLFICFVHGCVDGAVKYKFHVLINDLLSIFWIESEDRSPHYSESSSHETNTDAVHGKTWNFSGRQMIFNRARGRTGTISRVLTQSVEASFLSHSLQSSSSSYSCQSVKSDSISCDISFNLQCLCTPNPIIFTPSWDLVTAQCAVRSPAVHI